MNSQNHPPPPAKFGSFRYTFEQRSKSRLLSTLSRDAADEWGLRQPLIAGERRSCLASAGDALTGAWNFVKGAVVAGWEFGRADPRKAVFAAKAGLALGIISLLIFLREPFKDLASHCVWAILTVVVVFEFSIGATLSKGFNRGLGTLTAGGLALGVAELCTLTGPLEEVFIIISIFIIGFLASFIKLYPTMKPYEYGFRVFLLTFCFIMVSGYKTREFTQTAVSRFLLIALGAVVGLGVNVGIYPIWAGEDLHNLVAKNFFGVAKSLEGCVNGYLQCMEYERIPSKILTYQASDDPLYSGYRSAVESTSQEDALLSFAIWEPPHGPYRMLNYPWKNYVRLGGALRHCAFMIMALHGCILSEIQAPPESRQIFSNELRKIGIEGSKVLRELGNKVKAMTKLSKDNFLFDVHEAAEELQKKIDRKSYLLVNTESWEIRKPPEGTKGTLDGSGLAEEDSKILGPKLDSEIGLGLGTPQVSRNTLFQNPVTSEADMGQKMQVQWPSRQSFLADPIFNEPDSKTYESASALSLATFASLLIEFVARLQNVVDAFVELSEKANFKEPVEEPKVETVGFWTRLSKFFCLRN